VDIERYWLATLFSVVTFLACITGITYPTFLTYRMTRRENVAALYTEEPRFFALGALYAAYRQPRWFQFMNHLVASFIRSRFISFGHAHGLIQVIGLVVIELLLFGTLVVFRSGHTRGYDVSIPLNREDCHDLGHLTIRQRPNRAQSHTPCGRGYRDSDCAH